MARSEQEPNLINSPRLRTPQEIAQFNATLERVFQARKEAGLGGSGIPVIRPDTFNLPPQRPPKPTSRS